ncbi:hypothetical protein [Desulfocurvibacter africanus]|uniref:hypothetical protein n=1 Tax=Desulfocurvibacter africanus TaxID=873 RepID=UPI000423B337|nr:hypothetical protein [Desulfocurvibacter africanus]
MAKILLQEATFDAFGNPQAGASHSLDAFISETFQRHVQDKDARRIERGLKALVSPVELAPHLAFAFGEAALYQHEGKLYSLRSMKEKPGFDGKTAYYELVLVEQLQATA